MTSSETVFRYPGTQPFSIEQKRLFFGRDKDIEQLHQLLSLEDLVVLYSKSGLGKSSLLNAGLLPKLKKEKDWISFSIRFGSFTEEQSYSPLKRTTQIMNREGEASFLDKLLAEDDSLWYYAKHQQIKEGQKEILLIFDQFEEIFTYEKEELNAFTEQLQELLNSELPQRYRNALKEAYEKGEQPLSDAELELLHQPLKIKVVLAIRSDRMSLLNGLTPYLPNILRHCYELEALNEMQAEDAILLPAYLKGEHFKSPRFDYEDEALDAMLAFLTKDHSQKIESFQLQILCQNLEKRVIEKDLKKIDRAELGDIESIYKNHYDNLIKNLGDEAEQRSARLFIENGLIFEDEERRLSVYEGQVQKQYGISAGLLRKLVDSHLLRSESSPQGGFVYELSHDTLVGPVLEAKKRREEKEQKAAEEERLRKETEESRKKQERERRKMRRALLLAFIGLALALAAGFSAWFAFEQQEEAENLRIKAQRVAEGNSKVVLASFLSTAKKQPALALGMSNYLDYELHDAFPKAIISSLREVKNGIKENYSDNTTRVEAWEPFCPVDMLLEEDLFITAEKGMLRLWKSTGEQQAWWPAHGGIPIYDVQFSPSGDSIISYGWDDKKRYWDLKGEALGEEDYKLDWDYTQEKNPSMLLHYLRACRASSRPDDAKAVYQKLLSEHGDAYQTYEPSAPIGLQLLPVQGGDFKMGCVEENRGFCDPDELPIHAVKIGDFRLSKFEIMQGQWLVVMGDNPTSHPNCGLDCPIENINVLDIEIFLFRLNIREGKNYRLPTEAEWEYAARGGQQAKETRFAGSDSIDLVAWYSGNSPASTHPVGQKAPNELGMFDMTGNVWEWCLDWYAPEYYQNSPAKNPIGASSGTKNVLRGGAWNAGSDFCRVSKREHTSPSAAQSSIIGNYGFRVAAPPLSR